MPAPTPRPQCVTLVELFSTVKPVSSAVGGSGLWPSAQAVPEYAQNDANDAIASNSLRSRRRVFFTSSPELMDEAASTLEPLDLLVTYSKRWERTYWVAAHGIGEDRGSTCLRNARR